MSANHGICFMYYVNLRNRYMVSDVAQLVRALCVVEG
jgi:hypothetical protein